MGNKNNVDKSTNKENCVYHSIKEFKDKFLPESTLNYIVTTDEEARKLGEQLARESINNIKFDSLVVK